MNEEKATVRAETEEISAQKLGTSYILRGINGTVGEITYQLVDVDTWIIDHTYIDSRYRGHNLGRLLLDFVVEEAREKGRKIIPSCSYALEQFKRNPEYADVWERGENRYSDPYSSNSAALSKD
ncbi:MULTISPECIES: GNAT family N-acetyltransferase [unclassified Paenibacillus]|uniref:GNAT family N-acetyltransferase n=1 Tax=unclassified Paenibacillus TaxID=185978 RepID=UPI001AE2928B|nr:MULTISPECIES: GNAT family N-acetyltransferase [unclassified Paenibacillus]MBP1157641.1 putative GNAT family acetyltransferase [Paenibacillus sp. PvP091]MBP1171622.1 putative GNAT family acetyltransferase [Paenibacillus sp. PvR098]MBP2438003.1 putative GNAT family acetyltransferase [Paenibacillus sp. PvP052]